jgi:hypothetical protein
MVNFAFQAFLKFWLLYILLKGQFISYKVVVVQLPGIENTSKELYLVTSTKNQSAYVFK